MTDLARSSVDRSRLSNLTQGWTGLIWALPGLIVLAVFRPVSPDLVAQLARTAADRATTGATWWTSWYGGITTPSYSVFVPAVMRVAGVWVVALLSVVVLVWTTARLMEGSHRARHTVALVSFGAIANIASGRVTFAAGVALAAISLLAILRNRSILAVPFGIAAALASPLAGFFLGIVAVAIATQRVHRLPAAATAAALTVAGIAVEILYPLPGRMPMHVVDVVLGLLSCGLLWYLSPTRVLRTVAALMAIAVVGFFFLPSPVGSNILRLPMLFTGAALVATSPRALRFLLPIVIALMAWPAAQAFSDVAVGHDPSVQAAFYAPLLQHLPAADRATNRVEVVDPATHGPALHVASAVPLARGWERQVDVARNPLFYSNQLNATSYKQWLDGLAVGWVAVPNVPLDYASQAEAALVGQGLPYLNLIWKSSDWSLYEVTNPAPMATLPVTVDRVAPDVIDLSATQAADSRLSVAWTPGLALTGIDGTDARGTVTRDGDWIHVSVPVAGHYELRHAF